MRDIVKQDEEIRKRAKQAQNEKLNEAWKKAFAGIQQVNKIQYTEHQKEILKKVYRAGAKVLHSDINSESDEAMQFLNQLKESWGV